MESGILVNHAENRVSLEAMRARRLTSRQLAAIRLAVKIGDDIRKNNPEIAEEYRNGLTAPKLVARHGFDRRFGVSRAVAIDAVRYSIRGYYGPCYHHYHGLIEDRSERDCLAFAHNSQTGIELYERKLGIHAMTREQKVAAGRKGGLIRGPLSYRLRIGCHALSPEAIREHCRRIAPLGGKAGSAASIAARGLVPYSPAAPGEVAEIEFAFRLSMDPRYRGPVRANFRKLAEEVNKVFHAGSPRYTRTTLKIALQSHRRRNRTAAESPEDPEMSFTERMMRDRAYQLPSRIRAAEIARKVNEAYHGGRPVRSALGVRAAIQRYRRRNASPEVN